MPFLLYRRLQKATATNEAAKPNNDSVVGSGVGVAYIMRLAAHISPDAIVVWITSRTLNGKTVNLKAYGLNLVANETWFCTI